MSEGSDAASRSFSSTVSLRNATLKVAFSNDFDTSRSWSIDL